MSNNKISDVGINIAEKATVIWNVADMLRGPFKPHEYGLVILPMTVVKRFHDCLLPTHDNVLAQYEKVKHLAVIDGFLTRASGYQFYNTSKFTFETLLADPDNIETNFKDYLAGFSVNAQDVLSKFDFDNIIKRMVESNTLYLIIKEFNSEKGYLGADKISAVDCGYIFEDLVRRFSESFGEEAGAHFTSRDIIYLMTDLLLADANLDAGGMTVYDMTMGTSQMLSCMEERIHDLNSDIEVTCFGQEFNPSTYAIAKADMMIRGGDPDNMRFGDTLSDDQFEGFTFDYCISNPPFGIDWKREQKKVEEEAARGEQGRFAPGLPKISDGQQLFVLKGLSKLAPNGKMAIIQNGSPLFSGDAGSGPSEIRRYILENDWLDGNELCTNQGCLACVPLSMTDSIFFYYVISVFTEQFELVSSGTTFKEISANTFANFPLPFPIYEEQIKISSFLDRKCAELDNVLEKTRASIEEYKKLKQAVITQAVTKGVRGNREMKDSQSIWFGQIPRVWEMRKIKYIFKIQKDIAGEEGHTVLSITQKGIKPKDLSKNEGQLAENYSNYQLVHIGDFAMNHMDLLTGWVDVSKYEGVTSPDYRAFGLIDKDNYCSQYYLYLMQMCYTNRIFYGLGQGVSGLGRWRLQADKFLNFSITVPSYEEQKEIANYLDKKCSAIDELIAKKEQYLSEIENYKKSLIYEYVTGKKEVPQE